MSSKLFIGNNTTISVSYKIGVVDTTFARVDMGKYAIEELKKYGGAEVVRVTVPGMKDLAVACKKLLDNGCDVCLAIAMVGSHKLDEICAHEANMGIMHAQLMTNKHILGVFVHEIEANNDKELYSICVDRVTKHARNAYLFVSNPEELTKNAGTGKRQGRADAGPLVVK
ncbi:MAG: riboflavin synthase [Candidatus Aenigmarchaeota archaeon]|nr:riboflavin synthase [Candidatus Aenigmarchaeota archaeon]